MYIKFHFNSELAENWMTDFENGNANEINVSVSEGKEVAFVKKDLIMQWLSSFNTESATCCFTAVQELKKRLEGEG